MYTNILMYNHRNLPNLFYNVWKCVFFLFMSNEMLQDILNPSSEYQVKNEGKINKIIC